MLLIVKSYQAKGRMPIKQKAVCLLSLKPKNDAKPIMPIKPIMPKAQTPKKTLP